jgi:hypothetical protein
VNYHIARDGQQIGVYSREDVLARLARGEIRPTDLAWCEGMADWKAAGEVFGAAAPAQSVAVPPVTLLPDPVGMSRGTAAGDKPPKPPNYLVGAILVTLFCCLPFGVASIVFAAQVDSKYNAGDYAGAQAASNKAKTWMWVSLAVGAVAGIIYVGAMVAGALSSSGY